MKIIGISVLLLATGLASADCRVVRRQRVAVVNHHVAALVAVPVQIPTYSVTLAHGDDRLEKLEKKVDMLIEALTQKSEAPEPKAKANGIDVLKLFQAKCALCHEKAVAAKGGGFVLLDGGKIAPLNYKQALYVGTKTFLGSMPKGGPLTDEEVGAIQSWLDSLK